METLALNGCNVIGVPAKSSGTTQPSAGPQRTAAMKFTRS
jgi:hypothetical protein